MTTKAARVLMAVLVGLAVTGRAEAQRVGVEAAAGAERGVYFIDFRARPGSFLGHTFIIYGHVDRRGRVLEIHRLGLYPREDLEDNALLLALAPVPGEISAEREDFSQTPTAVYRRRLTAAQFAHLKATMRRLHRQPKVWHLVLHNCNDFVAQIAHELGLRTPPGFQFPDDFVRGLAMLNR